MGFLVEGRWVVFKCEFFSYVFRKFVVLGLCLGEIFGLYFGNNKEKIIRVFGNLMILKI